MNLMMYVYVLFSLFIIIRADPGPPIPFHLPKLRNNMLRVYVFVSPRPLRKGVSKKIYMLLNKTSDTVNYQIMDANSKYYSLSEEDRLIIETIISLLY
jgi:hypothetical protein